MNEIVSPTDETTPSIMRLALLFEGGLAIAACIIGLFLKTPPWRLITFSLADFGWGLAATIPMILGLLVLRSIRRGPLGGLNRAVDQSLVPLFAYCALWQLALISLIAGVGEELMFRGILQPVLIGALGIAPGLILASAIFGLLHAVTVSYAVLATLVGMYLGWLALATNNLLPPIIAHGLYDFVALLYLIHTSRRLNGRIQIPQMKADESDEHRSA
jgi:uncharacterized protein